MSNFIWINGKFLVQREAHVNVLTHSLQYSGAVFEGERSYNGKIFKFKEHTARLLKSAEYMGLEIKYSVKEIKKATYELLKRNSLQDAYIRPFIWRGAESLKIYDSRLSNNMLISTFYSKNQFSNGLKLNLGKWCKPSAKSLPPQAKSSAHYAMATVSQIESSRLGYDDSLILDEEGYVAECNVANIFFGKGRKIITPIADRFLNGITRQAVIKMTKTLGFEVLEKRVSIEEITQYDYSFITGTAREIAGIGSINLNKSIIKFFDHEQKVKLFQSAFIKLVGK